MKFTPVTKSQHCQINEILASWFWNKIHIKHITKHCQNTSHVIWKQKVYFKTILLKVLTINWSFMVDHYSKFVPRKRTWLRKWVTKLTGLTWSNLPNLSKSLMLQNNCRLMLEAMISRHIVNRIKCPSFFPGPKICDKTQIKWHRQRNM